jgi:3-oxoacyl-[acyl-carrier-protein] synthase-1
MPEIGIGPITEIITRAGAKHIISNSFGFGGNNASLLFSRYA